MNRYSPQIALPNFGVEGQQKLSAAKVLVIGLGGLGSPLVLYLAAAGVGTLGLLDDDRVSVSNLHRQILYHGVGQGSKAEAAKSMVSHANSEVSTRAHNVRLDQTNASEIIKEYDLVCDATDNFYTRFVIAKACYGAKKPMISGAALRYAGEVSTFKPYEKGMPCYRCLHPAPPPDQVIPTCENGGVLGTVTGIIGTMMANEVIKEIVGVGEGLAGNLLLWNSLDCSILKMKLPKDPNCPLCKNHEE